jgi:hypothetical protein
VHRQLDDDPHLARRVHGVVEDQVGSAERAADRRSAASGRYRFRPRALAAFSVARRLLVVRDGRSGGGVACAFGRWRQPGRRWGMRARLTTERLLCFAGGGRNLNGMISATGAMLSATLTL